MNDVQLLYFTTIAELGSFSEAALTLNISQSSISKQVMQLEDELDIELFNRSTRKVKLSPGGEILYHDANQILKDIKQMKKNARELSGKGKYSITFLALPVIGHYNFYVPIQLFENEHADVSIELEELEEPEMIRKINSGDFDAAITYYNPNALIRNAKFYPLVDDEMVLVCHKDDEFGNAEYVTPEMLNGKRVLSMQKYTCISQLYDFYFAKYNSNPNIIFRGRPETIIVGAEAHRGPALLTRIHTETTRINNTKLIPFSPSLKGILGIIVNNNCRHQELIMELVNSLK